MRNRGVRQLKTALLVGGLLVFGAGPALASYVSEVTSQNPLFYWRLNGTTYGVQPAEVDNSAYADTDAQINASTNTILGDATGPTLTPSGGFAGFEAGNTNIILPALGSGDFIANMTSPKDTMSSTEGSMTCWIKTTTGAVGSNAYGTIYRMDAAVTGTPSLYGIINNAGTIELRVYPGALPYAAQATTTGTYKDGQWHHVAFTWNEAEGRVTVYVDGGTLAGGEVAVSAYADITDFVSSGRHQIGKATNDASRYQGSLDEPAIWTRELTAQNIADQYLSAIPEPASMLLIGIGGLTLLGRRRIA